MISINFGQSLQKNEKGHKKELTLKIAKLVKMARIQYLSFALEAH